MLERLTGTASAAAGLPSERRAEIGPAHPKAARFGMVVRHVEGTRSAVMRDPSGNVVEIFQAG